MRRALAHAQTWTRLLADPGGHSLTLAVERGLATHDGESAVLVRRSGGGLAPAGLLYTLDRKGSAQPWTVTFVPQYPAAPFVPRRVSIAGGQRVGIIEQGHQWGPRNTLFNYAPGQDHSLPQAGTTLPGYPGYRIHEVLGDGVDGWLVAYDDPAFNAQPWLLWGQPRDTSPTGIHWGRYVSGCEQGASLPTGLLALDARFEPSVQITVLTRCLAPPAQGGGRIAVQSIGSSNGSVTGVRYSPLYGGTNAPVVAAQAIGGGRFLVDQATAAGVHTVRVIDRQADSPPLPIPAGFRVHSLVHTAAGGLVVAADPVTGTIGTLHVDAQSGATRWSEHPGVSDLDVADLRWSADAAGRIVAVYRDAYGFITLVGFERGGAEAWRRLVADYTAAPGSALQFAYGADQDELLLAAEVLLPDGRGGVHVEQFPAESTLDTIPWPPLRLPAPQAPARSAD